MALRTNRELYAHVLELARRPNPRPLEEYLRALWALAAPLSHRDALSLEELGALLEGALAAEAAAFGPDWREQRAVPWQETLRLQVVDLRELAASGELEDEQRYFGIDAPGGGRWYNFDVGSYLECGVQGAFGGWTPEENDGRVLVPGKVAVTDQAGRRGSPGPTGGGAGLGAGDLGGLRAPAPGGAELRAMHDLIRVNTAVRAAWEHPASRAPWIPSSCASGASGTSRRPRPHVRSVARRGVASG